MIAIACLSIAIGRAGHVQYYEHQPGWNHPSVRFERSDGLGLDAESEIAAYRTAISKCPEKKVVVLPQNTPDKVFLSLIRLFAGVTRKAPQKGAYWNVSITTDRLEGKICSGVLDMYRRSGDDFCPQKRVPFRLHGRQVNSYILKPVAAADAPRLWKSNGEGYSAYLQLRLQSIQLGLAMADYPKQPWRVYLPLFLGTAVVGTLEQVAIFAVVNGILLMIAWLRLRRKARRDPLLV